MATSDVGVKTTAPPSKKRGSGRRYELKTSIDQRTRAANKSSGAPSSTKISGAPINGPISRAGKMQNTSPDKSDTSVRSAPMERV